VQVVESLEVKNEISAGSDISKLEFSLSLLYLFEAILDQDLVLSLQISEYLHIKLISCLFDLHLN
jgi:hypothetical protein